MYTGIGRRMSSFIFGASAPQGLGLVSANCFHVLHAQIWKGGEIDTMPHSGFKCLFGESLVETKSQLFGPSPVKFHLFLGTNEMSKIPDHIPAKLFCLFPIDSMGNWCGHTIL